MLHVIFIYALYFQGRSACGVTRSLRTVATRWWSSSSEPSCTPRTANSSTSSAPESQVKYRSFICTHPERIKNGCELPLSEKCLRGGGEEECICLCVCIQPVYDLWLWECIYVCGLHSMEVDCSQYCMCYRFIFKVSVRVCSCIYNQ